jgi:hypothetical protein
VRALDRRSDSVWLRRSWSVCCDRDDGFAFSSKDAAHLPATGQKAIRACSSVSERKMVERCEGEALGLIVG